MNKVHLVTLREHAYFSEIVADLKKNIPRIPDYDPEDPQSSEKMKALSCKRQGFVFCMSLLGVSIDG